MNQKGYAAQQKWHRYRYHFYQASFLQISSLVGYFEVGTLFLSNLKQPRWLGIHIPTEDQNLFGV